MKGSVSTWGGSQEGAGPGQVGTAHGTFHRVFPFRLWGPAGTEDKSLTSGGSLGYPALKIQPQTREHKNNMELLINITF